MEDKVTTTETQHYSAPTQHTEPLPDWVREELGMFREKLPELRAGICAAIATSKGVLPKGEKNQDQGYKYTGYDSILDAVREPMAKAGITIEQVSCDAEEELHYSSRSGAVTLWKWRAIYLVTHTSGASVCRIVRTLTSPGNKSAAIASAGCDRLLITRLMRMASGKDEADQAPNDAAGDNRAWNARGPDGPRRPEGQRPGRPLQPPNMVNSPANPPPSQRSQVNGPQSELGGGTEARASAQHRDFTEAQVLAAEAFVTNVLIKGVEAATSRLRLLSWGRIIRHEVKALPQAENARAWVALKARCPALEIDTADLLTEVSRALPLKWEWIFYNEETGEMHDKRDGTLL